MFDIGWSELVVIGVVALIAIGPKELPTVLRTVGQWMGKIRRMAAEFQGQFNDAMREIEAADIKKQVDEATTGLNAKFDPLDFSNSAWNPNSDTASSAPASPSTESTGGSAAQPPPATPPSGTPEPPAAPAPQETAVASGEGSRPA